VGQPVRRGMVIDCVPVPVPGLCILDMRVGSGAVLFLSQECVICVCPLSC
jgi:hypothetical protein